MNLLLDKDQITALCSLGLNDIRRALAAGGEPDVDNEIIEVNFLGLNGHSQFVYEIVFPDSEEVAYTTGRIYVSQINGQPVARH